MFKKALQRIRYNIPKYIKDDWFAKVVHTEAKLPPAFDKDGKFIFTKGGNRITMDG